jgi:hypothetical protein
MKFIFLLPVFFLSFQLLAQKEMDLEPQEQVDEVITEVITEEPNDQTINGECNCPPPEVQAEEAAPTLNSIFPAGSVFLVSPEATSVAPVQKEEEQKEKIPGSVEKLQRGYSDESYKQIIRE